MGSGGKKRNLRSSPLRIVRGKEKPLTSSDLLLRWGGLAGVVAGVAYVMAWIVGVLFVPRWQWPGPIVLYSFPGYLAEFVFVVALLGTLVAIVGLHLTQRGRYGWTGMFGTSVAAVGHLIFLYATIQTVVRGTDAGPSLPATALLVTLIGMGLLGIATLFARALPRWCGLLIVIGYPRPVFFGVGYNAWAPYGWVPAVIWASVGYAFLPRSGDTPARQPARVG